MRQRPHLADVAHQWPTAQETPAHPDLPEGYAERVHAEQGRQMPAFLAHDLASRWGRHARL
ncbi:hypothetical protein [Nonomuraea sp. NPDC050783]|uniref:hypothetical protein n=1 Tax=Nonomuraea sp. NPDC050783 TaxID=3154634 RepID=UPI003467DCAD